MALGTTLDICSLPVDVGTTCSDLVDRYYYDYSDEECVYFTYGGCDGNANNFESLSLCQEECMGITSSSNSSDFSDYHIAGFVMIFIVVFLFVIVYYFKSLRENKQFEPHQVQVSNKKDTANKWNQPSCLYVTNISKRAIQNDIKELFLEYGKLREFEFKETRGDQLNICFVDYKLVDDANRAMGELNGVEIEGHSLQIQPGAEYKPIIVTNGGKRTK